MLNPATFKPPATRRPALIAAAAEAVESAVIARLRVTAANLAAAGPVEPRSTGQAIEPDSMAIAPTVGLFWNWHHEPRR